MSRPVGCFPSDLETRLGFDVVRERLKGFCNNEISRFFVDQMAFVSSPATLGSLHDQLREMQRLRTQNELPYFGFPPFRDQLKGLRPAGSVLSLEGLVTVQKVLAATYASQRIDFSGCPLIQSIVDRMDSLPDIRRRLHNLIDEEGNVKDTASSLLRTLRQERRSLESSVGSTMDSILREARRAGWVDPDATPVLRDGRLLLPVIPHAKKEVGGIVHAESATGQTLFMEPERVVAINNRIRETKAEERQEINRLLREFSDHLRPYSRTLQNNATALGQLDFLFAKSLLADAYDAIVPAISTDPMTMEWWKARHPLLEEHLRKVGRELVPLDIRLTDAERILVISGPNAGGKSVALKTVGLLQYMLQCGLAVPMQGHSICTLFAGVLLDIGDQQSMEDDLSTYSSHLQNMKYFVSHVAPDTLVLIDEFGSGTEPMIGGAIAEALLEKFRQEKTFGVITTHYSNIKDYTTRHEGLVNGAMLFDRQRIQPLYQLFIGQAGSSFAVEIARSIGLPREILDYASDLVGSDYMQQDKYLQDIMRDKAYWARKRLEVKKLERRLQDSNERLDEKLSGIHEKRQDIISKAERQALDILSSANATVERTIRDIKTTNADKERTKQARQKLEQKREKLRQKSVAQSHKRAEPLPPKAPIRVGDRVRLEDGNTVGEVLGVDEGKAQVRLGILTMWIPLQKLRVAQEPATEIQKRTPTVITEQQDERRKNFKPQLDCRGMRADEALQQVTHFVDDAIRYGYSPVRILHGTGTGALRLAIRELLSGNPRVRNYHDEHVDFGGAGITVVEL